MERQEVRFEKSSGPSSGCKCPALVYVEHITPLTSAATSSASDVYVPVSGRTQTGSREGVVVRFSGRCIVS
jgi:hypothetical protein